MTGLGYVGKVVIITGASSGIGRGCAEQFIKAGAFVVVCSNDQDGGAGVTLALRALALVQGCGDA